MRKFLPLLLAPFLAALTMWCLGSFVAMDANPANWEQFARVMIAMWWCCATFMYGLGIAVVTGALD